jgi:hypothetical protein
MVIDKNLIDIDLTIDIFQKYNLHNNENIHKKDFIRSFEEKLMHQDFKIDMQLLLKDSIGWDFNKAVAMIQDKIIQKLPS